MGGACRPLFDSWLQGHSRGVFLNTCPHPVFKITDACLSLSGQVLCDEWQGPPWHQHSPFPCHVYSLSLWAGCSSSSQEPVSFLMPYSPSLSPFPFLPGDLLLLSLPLEALSSYHTRDLLPSLCPWQSHRAWLIVHLRDWSGEGHLSGQGPRASLEAQVSSWFAVVKHADSLFAQQGVACSWEIKAP